MASISANGSRGHHRFTLNVNETSTNINNNTSTVSFNFQISAIQNGWDWNIKTNPVSYRVTINGTNYNGTIVSYGGSGTVTLKSGSLTVGHNNDGSKNIGFSFSVTDHPNKSYTPGNASASGSMNLTKIARYPVLNSGSNFTDEGNPTLKFTNYGVFNVRVKLEAGGNTSLITRDISKNATSYTFNLTEEERNELRALCPNSNSLSVRETVCAVNGTTEVNASYKDYTMTIVNGNPTFTDFTYKDTNTTVTNVIGTDQALVKGVSTLQATVSSDNKMIANKKATAKNYVATIDDINMSKDYSDENIVFDLGTIKAAGTKRLNVRAYDSRNNSALVYKDITVYDYEAPILNITSTRLNNFEDQTTLTIDGSFSSLKINSVEKNALQSVKYRYREVGGEWNAYVELTPTVNENNFTCQDVILSLDNTNAYEFEVVATDKLSSTTRNSSVDVGQSIFMISSNKKAVYINGQEVLMYEIVDEW